MLRFILGMMVGATLGIIIHCLFIIAKESEKN